MAPFHAQIKTNAIPSDATSTHSDDGKAGPRHEVGRSANAPVRSPAAASNTGALRLRLNSATEPIATPTNTGKSGLPSPPVTPTASACKNSR